VLTSTRPARDHREDGRRNRVFSGRACLDLIRRWLPVDATGSKQTGRKRQLRRNQGRSASGGDVGNVGPVGSVLDHIDQHARLTGLIGDREASHRDMALAVLGVLTVRMTNSPS